MAVSSVSGLGLSYYVDSTSYHPLEYLQDVYSFVFNKTIKGDEQLTQPELLLQGTCPLLMSSVADLTQTTSSLHLRVTTHSILLCSHCTSCISTIAPYLFVPALQHRFR